jgi:hypothetical protein
MSSFEHASGNDSDLPQACKKVEEAVLCRLVVEQAQFPAFAHVRHDLDGTDQVCIGAPWRDARMQTCFTQVVLASDFSPYGFGTGELLRERRSFSVQRTQEQRSVCLMFLEKYCQAFLLSLLYRYTLIDCFNYLSQNSRAPRKIFNVCFKKACKGFFAAYIAKSLANSR